MTNKITFINPKVHCDDWNKYKPKLAPYALAVLAGQVPDNWEPKIVDENVAPINFNIDADLIAITAATSAAPRAYEIADRFSEKEVPALLGGIHPTIRSFEASQHGTVVSGEAESILPQVLTDYENDNLQLFYDGGHCQLDKPKPPRFDLLPARYTIYPVQYSRGCPYNCEPCSVSIVSGHDHRCKEHQRFINEINACGGKFILVADDNFTGSTKEHKEDSKILLKRIKDEANAKLAAQVTVKFAEDRELMRLATESGFYELLIGFEDRDPNSLKEIGKAVNFKIDYKNVVNTLHNNGFSIAGSFLLGLDNHTKNIFSSYVNFIKDTEIDTGSFAVLTPFPGTRLEKRLRREGRIFRDKYPEDWKYYNINNVVFHPKNMTAEELEVGTLEALRQTANPLNSIYRSFKTLLNTRNVYGAGSSLLLNNSIGLRVRERLRKTQN